MENAQILAVSLLDFYLKLSSRVTAGSWMPCLFHLSSHPRFLHSFFYHFTGPRAVVLYLPVSKRPHPPQSKGGLLLAISAPSTISGPLSVHPCKPKSQIRLSHQVSWSKTFLRSCWIPICTCNMLPFLLPGLRICHYLLQNFTP